MVSDKDGHFRTTFSLPVKADTFFGKCWWSDQVFPGSQQGYRDFVLISEFSELEGPIPLAVVSEAMYIDLKEYNNNSSEQQHQQMISDLRTLGLERFDFNAFALRVVSTDRGSVDDEMNPTDLCRSEGIMEPVTPAAFLDHNNNNKDDLPSTKSTFSIPDDTQVYFTDADLKLYSFTHHLTLFDINARGYVHPVALSYITRDTEKIISRFEEFMDRFNEVSRLMKKGNYANFMLDLKCRLLDLEHTESLLHQQQPKDQEEQPSSSASASKLASEPVSVSASTPKKETLSNKPLHQAQTVTRLMIDTMESYSSQWIRTQQDLLDHNSEEVDIDDETRPNTIPNEKQSSSSIESLEAIEPSKDYQPKYVDTLYPVAHFERKLRSLSQLCHEPDVHQVTDASSSDRHYRRSLPDTSVIPLVSIIDPKRHKANKTPTTKRRFFSNAIKHDMYSEAIEFIKDLTAELGRNRIALELEEDDMQYKDPVSHAITFGHVFMLNLKDMHLRREPSTFSLHSEYGQKAVSDVNITPSSIDDRRSALSSHTNDHMEDDFKLYQEQQASYDSLLFPTAQLWDSKHKRHHGPLLHLLAKHKVHIHHVIFSLLTGRLVIIMGTSDSKSRIQELVNALSIFVPGLSKQHHQTIPWFMHGKLNQDTNVKLVGTLIECVDPSLYRSDVCCLEVDAAGDGHLITSPLYLDGQWIYQLLAKVPYYTADDAYIGFLHTVFMEMSLRAYVYYHKFLDDDDHEDSDEASIFTVTTNRSIDSRYTNAHSNSNSITDNKNGLNSTMASCQGSPSEDENTRQLGKKWSVRRIMNYLKRVEDGEPEDYFGNLAAATAASTSATNDNDPMHNTTMPVTLASSAQAPSSNISSTVSKSTPTSFSASSSVSILPSSSPSATLSVPASASALSSSSSSSSLSLASASLAALTSSSISSSSKSPSQFPYTATAMPASQEKIASETSLRRPIPAHLLSKFQAVVQQRQTASVGDNSQKTVSVTPSSSSTSSVSTSVSSAHDERHGSDHYSEDNEATVTLESIQQQSSVSVLQVNWNAPTNSTISSPSSSPSVTTTLHAVTDIKQRRSSEAFSELSSSSYSALSSLSSSRRNSSSNASTSYLSFSYDEDDDDDEVEVDDDADLDDYARRNHWSDDDMNEDESHQHRKQKPRQQEDKTAQVDLHCSAFGRSGQSFLEQTLHVIGDDQSIVTYLASLSRSDSA